MRFIIAIIAFAIAGAVFFLYTKPAYDSSRTLQAQIAEYNQALEKAGELQRLKQALLSRYNAFDPQDIDRLHKLLPDHVDNVRLVLDLDNLASSQGFALQNVVVSSPASEDGAEQPIGTISASNQQYDSLTFTFSTSGTYSGFVQFMETLEKSLRIVDLVSLSISPISSSDVVLPEPLYSYNVTIRTYWLK